MTLLAMNSVGCATIDYQKAGSTERVLSTRPANTNVSDLSQDAFAGCRAGSYEQVETTTHFDAVNKTPGRDWAFGIGGAALVGLGVWGVVDASNTYPNDVHSRTYNEVGPGASMGLGITALVAGGALLAVAGVDLVRSMGTKTDKSTAEVARCQTTPLAGASARYRVSASPPGPGEWTISLLLETCRGSCEQWIPAGDVPVYTCWASESAGVWNCPADHMLFRAGVSDPEGHVRVKSPSGSPARLKQEAVWKVFIPKTPTSPLYRTEKASSLHMESRSGLVEVTEIRFDSAFLGRVHEVESGMREADRAHTDRVVDATIDSFVRTAVMRCRDTPTEAQCDAMLAEARAPQTSPERRAEAESVYSQVLPTLDTNRWNAASPSCSAPTHSGSCDAVMAYLTRYPNGLHASEAQRALSRAAPTLERLARAEQAAAAERQRQRDGEQQRVKEACLAQCRAAGNTEHECWQRCT